MASKTEPKPVVRRRLHEEPACEEPICEDARLTPSAPASPAAYGGPANATDRRQPALGSSEIRREPRANALQHGLTATTLLSRVVQTERLEQWVAKLRAEYRPRTITEELLIREIARHASVLDITEQAEPAVMRQSMYAMEQLVLADDPQIEDHR